MNMKCKCGHLVCVRQKWEYWVQILLHSAFGREAENEFLMSDLLFSNSLVCSKSPSSMLSSSDL